MAAPIPRRPETPGVPGVRLPRTRGTTDVAVVHPSDEGAHDGRPSRGEVREVRLLLPPDDDETTLPNGSGPPESGVVRQRKRPSALGLDAAAAAELASIIAAWESADDAGRHLLAEFAKRLAGPLSK